MFLLFVPYFSNSTSRALVILSAEAGAEGHTSVFRREHLEGGGSSQTTPRPPEEERFVPSHANQFPKEACEQAVLPKEAQQG